MILSPLQLVQGMLIVSSLGNGVQSAPTPQPVTYYYGDSTPLKYETISLGEEQQKSYARLDKLSSYEYNWNGNGAEPFPQELINKCKLIVNELRYQPEIFPTAIDAIQFEYHGTNGSYIEFEIYPNEAKMYRIDNRVGKISKTIRLDEIKKEVDDFFESGK